MPADKLLVDHAFGSGAPAVLHPAKLNLPRQAMAANDVSAWKLDTVIVSSSGALSRVRKSRTTLTPLLQSSRRSTLLDAGRFAATSADDLLAERIPAATQPHVIAARLEGPAYSAFPDGIDGQPAGLQKAAQIEVVVVADTDLLMDAVINSAPNNNVMFVLNTLDNLAAPDVLASIQPRASSQSCLLYTSPSPRD